MMMNQSASLEYRRAATQQASVVGLVIALHDTLMGDLRRAAEAMERNDIPTRCEQLIHGFKVLTQLEAMLNREEGGAAVKNIARFYSHVRGQMLKAQFKLDPAMLRKQVQIVMEVRQAWEQVDSSPSHDGGPRPGSYGADPMAMPEGEAVGSFSCSG
jgi:flagellar protein FliS